MAKNPIPLVFDLKPDRPRSKLLPIASLFVCVPLLAPLVWEAVLLGYARWRDVLGTSVDVRTPVLDAIGESVDSVWIDLRNALASHFQRVPWNPKVVVPVAVVIMALAMGLLRR